MDSTTWQTLMDRVVEEAEQGSYVPGNVQAPGTGHEGDAPDSMQYADLGPLAYVLNEAIDATVNRGGDRDMLYEQIAHAAGEGITVEQIVAVLSGELKCPPRELIMAFGSQTAIDTGILIDAAQRGGCKDYGPSTFPEGY